MSIKLRVKKLETTIRDTGPYYHLSLLSDEELETRLRALCISAGVDPYLSLEEMVKEAKCFA